MDIDEFVRETILGVLRGVSIAQTDAEHGRKIGTTFRFEMGHQKDHRGIFVHGSNNYTIVEFDVAVTTETGTGAKGGIKVLGFVGADANAKHTSTIASRIKFSVPILLPHIEGT